MRPVAVVTGGSSGLGAEFGRQLAGRGYDLILVARRREKLEVLAGQLAGKFHISVRPMIADLARDEDVEAVARTLAGETNLELLVNNAGFGSVLNFFEADLDTQMRMHRVHVLATVRLTHAALKALVPRNRGGVINVSSVAGFSRVPGHASYSATKAWMTAFTECIHLELRAIRSAVRIQALCPGYTYTEFHDVLGMDREKIMSSRGFWMSADFVVSESLKAYDRGRWLVIPGWRYRMLTFILNALPRPLLHPAAIRFARTREASPTGTPE